MTTDNDLPGTALPLPEPVQDAIDEFNRPVAKEKAIRTATLSVLFDDLKADIKAMLARYKGRT